MRKKLTITIDEEVYRGLCSVVGRGGISRFLTELARPHVLPDALDKGYQEMAADPGREEQALEWSEGLVGDVNGDVR